MPRDERLASEILPATAQHPRCAGRSKHGNRRNPANSREPDKTATISVIERTKEGQVVSTTPGVEAASPQLPAPTQIPTGPQTPTGSYRSAARVPFAFERGLGGAASPLANQRVAFTAACPACGRDIDWLQVREDTRTRSVVRCGCERASEQAELAG